jgi:hypothetical protein
MTELLAAVTEIEGRVFDSYTQADSSKRRLLRQIESRARELADSTKNWKQFKEQGRSALAPELQVEFDKLAQMCAIKGLFINPCGELESMLTEHGIPYTTDKKAWIRTALQLLASLTVDFEKYPWKFVKGIHDQILDKGDGQNEDDGADKSTEPANGRAAEPAHRLEDRAGETAGKDNPKIKGHGFDWRSGGQIDGSGFGDSPGRVLLTIYRGLREYPTGGGGLLKIWRMPILDIGGDSIRDWTDDHIEFAVTVDFQERIERFKSETDRRAAENHSAQQDSLELGFRYMVVTADHHSAESVPSMPHVPVETIEV